MRRNLISGSSLVQLGYKIVLESNRVIISKNNVFIGKGYVCDGLFKLNNVSSLNKISKVFNVETSDIWHKRLGHINMKKIRRMMDLGLVPSALVSFKHKCEINESKGIETSMKFTDLNIYFMLAEDSIKLLSKEILPLFPF